MNTTTKRAGKATGGGKLHHVYVGATLTGAVVELTCGGFVAHRFSAAFTYHDSFAAAVASLA